MENIYIERKNPQSEFYNLLYVKGPNRYILRINNKYKCVMSAIFWNTLIKYFHKVKFIDLKDDILYEIEDIYIKEK